MLDVYVGALLAALTLVALDAIQSRLFRKKREQQIELMLDEMREVFASQDGEEKP